MAEPGLKSAEQKFAYSKWVTALGSSEVRQQHMTLALYHLKAINVAERFPDKEAEFMQYISTSIEELL